MQNQNQSEGFQKSNQMNPQMKHGGHEVFMADEAIGDLISGMELPLVYEQYIQDPELKTMIERHKAFQTQLYNTIVDTWKTGQDPQTPTQTYEMTESNDVLYGMKPSQPKSPAQSVNEINDECITGYMMGSLKACAISFTSAALETTNPVLRRVFSDSIPNIIEMAYEVFLYQNKHQYYQVPQLQQEDMQNYLNGFSPIQGENGNMMH